MADLVFGAIPQYAGQHELNIICELVQGLKTQTELFLGATLVDQ